ncbi:MAG: DUF192 domain-containing protein [Planctomycetota bacterium]|jgi:uncharacterized membrane protein (UPF0127 family)
MMNSFGSKCPRLASRLPALLLLAAAVAAAGQETKPDQEEPPTEKVVLSGETFKLEIAADVKARTRGLMGRKEIDEHGGMLFVFPSPGRRSFWMKNCLVNIDLAFLDRRGRIIGLHRMKAEPPRHRFEGIMAYERRLKKYPSRRRCQFAIELKSGSIDRLKLEQGLLVELDLARLKKMAR